jgi:hypothetical protein
LLAGGAPLALTKDDVDHYAPRWAPDSSSVIYFTPGGQPGDPGTIWEIPGLGGTPRRLTTSLGPGDLSHDGTRLASGDIDQARREFDREMEFLGRTFHALKARVVIELHARLGASLLALREEKAARSALDFAVESFERRNRISGGDPFTRYYGAGAYALRGDEDAALLELERAAAEFHAYTVARARIDPFFESLRGAPRFQAMVTSLAR